METHSKNLADYLTIVVTSIAGCFSLLLFCFFLLGHSFTTIEFGFKSVGIYTLDALLCLAFFVQHSAMTRKGFRNRLSSVIPRRYHGAIYTVASSVALFILVLYWQHSTHLLFSLDGEFRWAAHAIFIAALTGVAWGMSSLSSSDMLGIRSIMAHIGASESVEIPLTIRGPYRWTRHPLYFFVLVMIWSCPDVTTDRLLFNLCFTVWIVLGTLFEERDLVAEFGDAYIDYQGKVPMLIPWKLHSPFPSGESKNDFR